MLNSEYWVRIEFGHDCTDGGRNGGKDHHCYWVSRSLLEPLEEDKPVKIRWYSKGHLSESLNNSELKIGDYVEVIDYSLEEFNGKVGTIIGNNREVYVSYLDSSHQVYDVKFPYRFSRYQWDTLNSKDTIGLSRVIGIENLKKSSKEEYDKWLDNKNRNLDIYPYGEEDWE